MALESFAVGYNGNNKILQMFSNAISKLAKDLRHKWVRTNDDEEYNALRGDINCETFDRRGDSYPHFEAVKNYPTYSQVLNFGNLSSFGEEGTDIKEHTMPSYNITYVRIGTGGCITANESRDAYPNITYAFKGLSPFTSYTISFDIFQMPQYINQDTSYAYGVLIANDEFNVGCPQISENWYDSIEKKWYYRWAFDLPSGDIAGGGKLFTDISQNMKAPVDSFAYGKYQIKGLYQSFFRTENTHSYSLNTYSNSKGEIYFQVLLTAVNDLQFGWENFKIENLKISQYVQNKTYLTITDIYSYADQWIKYDKNSNAIYDLKDEDPDSRLGKDNDLCVRYSNHPDDSISIVADQDYSCWQVTDITEVTEGGFNVTIEGHNRYVDPEAQYPVVQKPYTKILLTDLEPGVEYTLNYRYYTPNMEDVTYRGAGNYIRFDYLEPQRIFWAIMPPDDPDEYHPYLRTDSITFIPMNSTMTIYICERGYNLSNEDKTLIIHFFVNKSSLDNFFVKLKGRWESVYSGGGGSSSLAGLNDVSLTLPESGFVSIVGASGSGKTLIAKKLAEEIFGDEKALVRIDMSEYSEKSSVAKLTGASPGYIGYENGGQLTEQIKHKQHCVLLLDEIEKADQEVYNIFLQLFDDGRLTDGAGQVINFKNVIVLMTSNIGAKQAAELGDGVGFVTDKLANKKSIIEKQLKQKFAPEFLNRIDKIVYFNELTDDNLRDIVTLEINKFGKRLKEINYNIKYDDKVVSYIHEQAIKQKEFGARPILRLIQNNIEDTITDLILEHEYEPEYTFSATCESGKIRIK